MMSIGLFGLSKEETLPGKLVLSHVRNGGFGIQNRVN
jgi:hypothetical protein